jgi:hypothetical protein
MDQGNKLNLRITVDIRIGPASSAQQAAWKRFWTKLIADANHDLIENQANSILKEAKNEKG